MNAYRVPLTVRNCFRLCRCSFSWQRPFGPSSALANSSGLTSPWVECARTCYRESRLIPSFWKIKGGHVYFYLHTIYVPSMGAYIISILESNWLVPQIYVNMYLSQKIDCPLCALPRGLFFCVYLYEYHSTRMHCSTCTYGITIRTSHSIASDR
jgi:hypothetical protein